MNSNPVQPLQALSEALEKGFRILRFVMIVLVAGFFVKSSLVVVDPHEVALVLRLGRVTGLGPDRILQPGWHWALPYPVDRIVRVPLHRVQTFRSKTFWYNEAMQAPPPTLQPGVDGYALTGDAHILHSIWEVRYTIKDPETFVFGFDSQERVLEMELDRAVVRASARFKVDDILRADKAFRDAVEGVFTERCGKLPTGVTIERVDLVSLSPPLQVKDAFDNVLKADQEKSTRVNSARTEAARILNEAGALAARRVAEAEAAKNRQLSEVKADAGYFDRLLPQYRQAPSVVARTLLQDTLRRVWAEVDDKYLIRGGNDGNRELRLNVSPEPARRKPAE